MTGVSALPLSGCDDVRNEQISAAPAPVIHSLRTSASHSSASTTAPAKVTSQAVSASLRSAEIILRGVMLVDGPEPRARRHSPHRGCSSSIDK